MFTQRLVIADKSLPFALGDWFVGQLAANNSLLTGYHSRSVFPIIIHSQRLFWYNEQHNNISIIFVGVSSKCLLHLLPTSAHYTLSWLSQQASAHLCQVNQCLLVLWSITYCKMDGASSGYFFRNGNYCFGVIGDQMWLNMNWLVGVLNGHRVYCSALGHSLGGCSCAASFQPIPAIVAPGSNQSEEPLVKFLDRVHSSWKWTNTRRFKFNTSLHYGTKLPERLS